LIAQEDAELEEGSVAAADLGQANELRLTDDHLVRGQRSVAAGEQQARKWITMRPQGGNVGARFGDPNTACGHAEFADAIHQVIAEPTIGLGYVDL
jgi:hypothetical protein